jgi:transposase
VENLIEPDHSARGIWELVGRLDLSHYYSEISAVEGHAGRDHTAPQLLISLWLYAYSRGVSSAREVARKCAYEPGFAWLCGLQPISHRTLAGFRSDHKEAVDDLFVQVVGMLSAEGLITMERFTLDGTKIKANASGNTFRRKDKIEAHLALAREQVQTMNEQAAQEEKLSARSGVPRDSALAVWKRRCAKWNDYKRESDILGVNLLLAPRRPIQKLMLCATGREARFPASMYNL